MSEASAFGSAMLAGMSSEPIRLEALHAAFAIERPAPGVVRVESALRAAAASTSASTSDLAASLS
jgi:hypothetical protein